MAEMPTLPGWQPKAKARPWWASALLAGLGTGAALAAALGLASAQARGSEPQQKSATVAAQSDNSDRLTRIENKLSEVSDRLSHIEGRLDRK